MVVDTFPPRTSGAGRVGVLVKSDAPIYRLLRLRPRCQKPGCLGHSYRLRPVSSPLRAKASSASCLFGQDFFGKPQLIRQWRHSGMVCPYSAKKRLRRSLAFRYFPAFLTIGIGVPDESGTVATNWLLGRKLIRTDLRTLAAISGPTDRLRIKYWSWSSAAYLSYGCSRYGVGSKPSALMKRAYRSADFFAFPMRCLPVNCDQQ